MTSPTLINTTSMAMCEPTFAFSHAVFCACTWPTAAWWHPRLLAPHQCHIGCSIITTRAYCLWNFSI